MSRTYRRKLKSRKMRRGQTGKTRNGDALTKELPPCYQNARRTHCAAAGVTKWWFHSKGAAIEAAKYNYFERFNRGQSRKYERAYHCSACDGWHLTTMDYEEWTTFQDYCFTGVPDVCIGCQRGNRKFLERRHLLPVDNLLRR